MKELWAQNANPVPGDTTGGIATCGAARRKHAMVGEGAQRLERVNVRLDGRARLARFAQQRLQRRATLKFRRRRGCMGGSVRQDACGTKRAKA